MAHDVADRHAQAPTGQFEHVVPVTADLVGGRQVPGGGGHPDDVDEPLGQQAALQDPRDLVLALQLGEEPGALDARRRARRRHLEDGQVALAELPGHERPDVQHADQLTLDDQRNARAASGSPSRAGSD